MEFKVGDHVQFKLGKRPLADDIGGPGLTVVVVYKEMNGSGFTGDSFVDLIYYNQVSGSYDRINTINVSALEISNYGAE